MCVWGDVFQIASESSELFCFSLVDFFVFNFLCVSLIIVIAVPFTLEMFSVAVAVADALSPIKPDLSVM